MKRILVVDDAAFMRMTLKLMLERHGFEVVGEAENGAIGVSKYQDLRPDIVTMDMTMPEMQGIEALKLIRQIDPEAKVIMVSAMGQEQIVLDAILNGAKAFIVKPFKEDHVIQTINKILSN